MRPRDEDIRLVKGYGARRWSMWLRKALEVYFIDKEGISGFKPFEYCILREHTLWADLQNIYDGLAQEDARMMILGTALLLKELPLQEEYVKIFETLLNFGAATGAKQLMGYIPRHNRQGFRRLSERLDFTANQVLQELGNR